MFLKTIKILSYGNLKKKNIILNKYLNLKTKSTKTLKFLENLINMVTNFL